MKIKVTKENCTGCKLCAVVCPDVAIIVYKEPKAKNKKSA